MRDLWVLVADDQTLKRQLVLITNVPLVNISVVQDVYNDWRLRTRIEHGYRFAQEQGLDVEDMRVHTVEKMRRLFTMILLAAQIVFVISVQWPPKAVLWIRQLGGKLGNPSDRDGPLALTGLGFRYYYLYDPFFCFFAPFPFSGLYLWVITRLLNWRGDVEDPLDSDEALPQLEYIAWAMCNQGVQRLRRDELLALLEDVRREYPNIRPVQQQTPENFLAQLERRTGLLVEMGHEQYDGRLVPVYEFRHLTFQEYLAALAIIEGRYPGHNRQSTLADRVRPLGSRVVPTGRKARLPDERDELQVSENWREALRLCIASCNDDDVDAALLAILGDQGSNVSAEARPRAILAASCLADEPNVHRITGETVLKQFANQISKDDGDIFATELDRAAYELVNSPWFAPLETVLIHEFLTRKPESRSHPGGLLATLVVKATMPVENTIL